MHVPGRLTDARRLLQRHFGYHGFRPGQLRVIGPLLAAHDVLAVLPTGGGKSICYQVPALLSDRLTLVVSPLVSLMQDQVGALRARGVPAAMLASAQPSNETSEALDGLTAGRWRLLYVAPERLPNLFTKLPPVGLLAVDEAHCVSEWGLSFRPAYRRLGEARLVLGAPQCVALTGSATPDVRRDIIGTLRLRNPEIVLGSFDRPNLTFSARQVASDPERFRLLLQLLQRDAISLVYAPTRKLVEDLTRNLLDAGFSAAPYHAGLEAPIRRRVLRAFLSNRVQVVVATSAFGMGIDKPDVRLVAHWGPPPTPEAYYQEAGRAGRDGLPSQCVLLYTKRDLAVRFAQLRAVRGPRARAERIRFEAMTRYLHARACRRAALLGYFGELLSVCSGCDRCGDEARLQDDAAVRATSARAPDRRIVGRLLAWRRRTAVRLKLPESALLDATAITAIARHPPESATALADIPGVGPELVARHGRSLLRAVAGGRRSRVAPTPPAHPDLYGLLRAWRARLARDAGLPAYCIVGDRALRSITDTLPATREELARVPGIGPRTLAKHGAALLALVAGYSATASSSGVDRASGAG